MKIISGLKSVAVGSVPLFLMVGCGGGSGSGGGPSPNLEPAAITEETVHEAAAVGLMLDEQLMGTRDLADMAGFESVGGKSTRSIVPQAVSVEVQPKHSKTNVLSRISRNLNLSQHVQTSRAMQPRSQNLAEEIPCDTGNIKLSGNESSFTLRFNNCTYYSAWSDGDSVEDTTNGSVTFSESAWPGYEFAYKAALNLSVKTEEVWYGQSSSGEWVLKGSMIFGANHDSAGLEIGQYDLVGKGKDVDGSWDAHFWIRDYWATIDFDGSKEVVKYAGKAGVKSSEAKLNGTLQIATKEALHYEAWRPSEFAFGEAVEAVGANNDVLRVEFDPSGTRATAYLNGRLLEEFSSFDDFECWVDGYCQ